MKRLVAKGLLAVTVLAIVGACAWGWTVWQWLHEPVGRGMVVDVTPGDSVRAVERELDDQGIIQWPRMWSFYARFVQPKPLMVGEYQLDADDSLIDVLGKMQSGEVVQYQVALIEGHTVRQMLAVLHRTDGIRKTLEDTSPQSVAKALGLSHESAEGWIYPDTYQFTRDTTDIDMLKRAVKTMEKVLAEEWANKADNLPYANPYEALVMASIVERETGVGHERPQIAGVFVRRLQKRMRLQTDPSVIYGMGERYQGNITRKDLRTDTPFNTYTRGGLTPTPIANPGRAAVHAALHPADGTALYFVARGDGSHYFSDTLAEHNRAVRQYQLNRKKNYRSSPQ